MITIITRDTYTLPNQLLPAFKAHERIDFASDDALCQDLLARAIERFEIKTETAIFPAQYLWTPDEWTNGQIKVPRPPVSTWSAAVGVDDVSSAYVISSGGFGGEIAAWWLSGTWQAGLEITIATGFAATVVPPPGPVPLPPGIRDVIFRLAGHMYEYREIYVPNNVNPQSGWMDDMLSGYWQPRA